MDGLPTDVLRLVLRAVLGEERQDAYRLMRPLTTFMLVCKHWRQAALQTPLSINVDYMQELPTAAVRWLQRMTVADLQVNLNMPVSRVLTHPDFAARNRWTLHRLWGAAVPCGLPGRGPQFRRFPRLATLELACDHSMAQHPQLAGDGASPPDASRFESRLLAPLAELKHLNLSQWGSADLSRLPPSLEALILDVYSALPLALPEGLVLQELTLVCTRLLVDWTKLCCQVSKLISIESPVVEVLGMEGGGSVFQQVATGFTQGRVEELEMVAQEMALVALPPDALGPRGTRRIPDEEYSPEVLEAVHTAALAAEFQAERYRAFGCTYNPDDIQADEELGMTDGVTVKLYRYQPEQPQTLGFSHLLSPEQLSFLMSEARVEGLALEAVDREALETVLNNEEFQRRCGPTLRWLLGIDLYASLQLRAFPELRSFEGYVLNHPETWEAVSQLPASLTCLDLCGVCQEDVEVTDRESWPSFRPAFTPGHSVSHLTQLQTLSLRHFRDVYLVQADGAQLPASVEDLTLECLRPIKPYVQEAHYYNLFQDGNFNLFEYELPSLGQPLPLPGSTEAELGPLPGLDGCGDSMGAGSSGGGDAGGTAAGGSSCSGGGGAAAGRTLTLQFHRSVEYPLKRCVLHLEQLLHAATHLIVAVTADPPPVPPEGEEEGGEEPQDSVTTLVLVAPHGSLQQALDALTASRLQTIELEADKVLFVDADLSMLADSRVMLPFIQQHYAKDWLCWAHVPDDPEAGTWPGGGFTMRRRH